MEEKDIRICPVCNKEEVQKELEQFNAKRLKAESEGLKW